MGFWQVFGAVVLVFGGFCEASRCRLPWTGVWLENGNELNITHNSIGALGSCVQKSRDLYLMTSETNRGACYRCLITFPVHENVLHYKTTQCIFERDMSLERCSQLMSADTTMHTLFRKDASPVSCPIEAPLNFTYQSNYGICNSRMSHLHRCAEYERLALHYEACPEIPNQESKIWQMECIGSWNSYGLSYFAARVGYSGGEQYKCFILEKSGSSGRIGESADSGCQELTHLGAAAKTISYRQDSQVTSHCDFPVEMTKNVEKYRFWESMQTGMSQKVYRGTWISSIKLRNDTVWTCLENFPTVEMGKFVFRVYVTKGCTVGYQCMRVIMTKSHLVHVEYGDISSSDQFVDCSEFVVETRDTLILAGSQVTCPIGGKHFTKHSKSNCGEKEQEAALQVGCITKYSMKLIRDCEFGKAGDELDCVSHFKHEDNDFMIVRDSISRQLYCMTYISDRIKLLRLYDRVSCDAVSVNSAIPSVVLNFTHTDSCSPSLLTGFLYSTRNTSSGFFAQNFSFVVFLFFLVVGLF